ncbi:MAG: hypothetical protein AAF672_09670 [Pseudomonadota bacterium]
MTTTVLPAPDVKAGLSDLSKALQELHRHLLMYQADEAFFTGSPLELYEVASRDPAFAWLKPLQQAIVDLDIRRAEDAPVSEAETRDLSETLEGFIAATSGPFRDKLNAVFQSDPEAVWAIGAARKALADFT